MERFNARPLKIALWAALVVLLLGSYQNFSDLGSAKYEYHLIDIGHLGSEQNKAYPTSLNSRGEVAGYSATPSGDWHAFKWTAKQGMKDLGTLGGKRSLAYFIGETGDVVGESEDKKGVMKPFIYRNGQMTELQSGRDTGRAYAINDRGEVVGALTTLDGISRAVAWDANGKMRELVPSKESRVGAATSIDSNGHIVGWSGVTLGNLTRGFIWKGSQAQELNTLGGHSAMAYRSNLKGWVVGEAESSERVMRPVLWKTDSPKHETLDLFSSLASRRVSGKAVWINAKGEVVGNGMTPEGAFSFIWSPDQGLRNLSRMVRETDPEFPNRNWNFQHVTALNNCGHIVGYGSSTDLKSGGAFLLFPVKPAAGCETIVH